MPSTQVPKSDQRAIESLVNAAAEFSRGDGYRGKRRKKRFNSGLKLEAVLDLADSESPFPITMQNVSGLGIAFWARFEIERGTDLYIREFSSGDPHDWIGISVTRCAAGLRGQLCGAEFHNPVTEVDLPRVQFEADDAGEECTDETDEATSRSSGGGLLGWLGLSR